MTPIRVAHKSHGAFVCFVGLLDLRTLRERTKRDVEHKEKRRFFRGGGLKPGYRTAWIVVKGLRGEIEKKRVKVCFY